MLQWIQLATLCYPLWLCFVDYCDGTEVQQKVPDLFVVNARGILKYRNMTNQKPLLLLKREYTKRGVAMDVDVRNEKLYWSSRSGAGDFVFSIDLDTRKIEKIMSQHVDGLAVDWVQGNLYVSDSELDRISVSRLDGSNGKVLVSEGLQAPRALVADPWYGWIYWTDWGSSPKIEMCGMNGEERRAIVTADIGWPNGLAIDHAQRRLYWVDAKLDYIASVDMIGNDKRTLLEGVEGIKHPFSIAVFEDYVYWTDWRTNSVYKISKTSCGEKPAVFASSSFSGTALSVYDLTMQPVKVKHCGEDYGGCSHLCLPVPQRHSPSTEVVRRFECSCPDGMVLFDDQRCINISDSLTSDQSLSTSGDLEGPLKTLTTLALPEDIEETLRVAEITTQRPASEVTNQVGEDTTNVIDAKALKTRLKEIWTDLIAALGSSKVNENTDVNPTQGERRDVKSVECSFGDYNCRYATVRVFINRKAACCMDNRQLSYTSRCEGTDEEKMDCKCS